MLLVVGLGNPGKEYQNTRHNVGFEAIECLLECWSKHNHESDESKNFHIHPYLLDQEKNKKFEGAEFELDVETKEADFHVHVGLLKPLTFMNKSGEVVKEIVKSLAGRGFDVSKGLLVVHDEMDLPFGELKMGFGRGSARHNGVQNIIDHLGTQEFSRLRIGVGRDKEVESKDFVLSKFNKLEEDKLGEVKELSEQKIEDWILNAVRAGAKDVH